MIANLFMKTLLRMSLGGTILLLLLLPVRTFLLKHQVRYRFFIWGLIGLRLILPVSIRTPVSLWNLAPMEVVSATETTTFHQPAGNIIYIVPRVPGGLPFWIYVGGMMIILLINLAKIIRLQITIKTSVHLCEQVYMSDYVDAAFVTGLFRPRIIVPSSAKSEDLHYIILHEQCHIKHRDQITRLISWIIVLLHWFNPFVWIGFYLLSTDIEIHCDECVVKKIGKEKIAEYAEVLLRWTTISNRRKRIFLGLGGGNLKKRLFYLSQTRKIGMGVLIISVIASAIVVLLCGTQAESSLPNVIERYYDQAYASWYNLEMENLDDVLDMNSIQSKNFVTALKSTVYKWQYTIDKGYFTGERRQNRIWYDYKSFEVSDDGEHATAVVDLFWIDDGTMPAYPEFVAFGENRFDFVRINGEWKISGHEYTDMYLFEKSKDKEIEFDKEDVIQEVESSYHS